MTRPKIILTCTLSFCCALLIDQLTKFIIIKKVPFEGIFLLKSNHFTLKLEPTFNANLAFSLHLPQFLIMFLVLLGLAALLYWNRYLIKHNHAFDAILIAAITGGAAANLLDRITRTGVIDFISVNFYNLNWPSFNLADAIISVGLIIVIVKTLLRKEI